MRGLGRNLRRLLDQFHCNETAKKNPAVAAAGFASTVRGWELFRRLFFRLSLVRAVHHHFLDLGDGFRWVQVLRANLRAVQDGMTTVKLELIFELVEPFGIELITAVGKPAMGLQQRRRPEIFLVLVVFLAVPPIGRA